MGELTNEQKTNMLKSVGTFGAGLARVKPDYTPLLSKLGIVIKNKNGGVHVSIQEGSTIALAYGGEAKDLGEFTEAGGFWRKLA
jgi:hypothetical protein